MKIRNPGDWLIASVVVLCSIILCAALAFALSGTFLGRPGQIVYADFEDITGIDLNSEVKFAGASAGLVTGVEILSPKERLLLKNPGYAVRLRLTLNSSVPPLPANVRASVASDTLLSEKFVSLDGGDPSAGTLEAGAVISGISPTTFDQLIRNADNAIVGIQGLMGGTSEHAVDIFESLRSILGETESLLGDVRPVIVVMNDVATEARGLVVENRQPLNRAITGLESTSLSLQSLANRGTDLLAANERNLTSSINDLKVTSQNAKVATTYARILALRLAQNPSQLVWGTKTPPPLPSVREILNSPKPVPVGE